MLGEVSQRPDSELRGLPARCLLTGHVGGALGRRARFNRPVAVRARPRIDTAVTWPLTVANPVRSPPWRAFWCMSSFAMLGTARAAHVASPPTAGRRAARRCRIAPVPGRVADSSATDSSARRRGDVPPRCVHARRRSAVETGCRERLAPPAESHDVWPAARPSLGASSSYSCRDGDAGARRRPLAGRAAGRARRRRSGDRPADGCRRGRRGRRRSRLVDDPDQPVADPGLPRDLADAQPAAEPLEDLRCAGARGGELGVLACVADLVGVNVPGLVDDLRHPLAACRAARSPPGAAPTRAARRSRARGHRPPPAGEACDRVTGERTLLALDRRGDAHAASTLASARAPSPARRRISGVRLAVPNSRPLPTCAARPVAVRALQVPLGHVSLKMLCFLVPRRPTPAWARHGPSRRREIVQRFVRRFRSASHGIVMTPACRVQSWSLRPPPGRRRQR